MTASTKFWLGYHIPSGLWGGELHGPVFVSVQRLRKRKSEWPRSLVPIALDSAGFSQITMHGQWLISPAEHVAICRRAIAELGTVEWAAIQDWMCEDDALARTGLSIAEHQRRTIVSYETLLELAPEVRWVPALQGRSLSDYMRHLEDYKRAGHDLLALDLVGLGSVCRRQATAEIVALVRGLASTGLRLHGFGVKSTGLELISDALVSADSMAWSFEGRVETRETGRRDSKGRGLGNSPEYAEVFRQRMLALIAAPKSQIRGYQLDLL